MDDSAYFKEVSDNTSDIMACTYYQLLLLFLHAVPRYYYIKIESHTMILISYYIIIHYHASSYIIT